MRNLNGGAQKEFGLLHFSSFDHFLRASGEGVEYMLPSRMMLSPSSDCAQTLAVRKSMFLLSAAIFQNAKSQGRSGA